MTSIKIPFQIRPEQQRLYDILNDKRFVVFVCHRRLGKTVMCIIRLIEQALTCTKLDPRFAYIAPHYNQAKNVAWLFIKKYTFGIPGMKYNESELTVKFPDYHPFNGATIRLLGAQNPDALRGIYLDGVVLDEVAQMPSELWGEVIRPTLADRKGWAIFIGTPKGVNLFSELYFAALKDEDWGTCVIPVTESSVLDDKEIDNMRKLLSDNQFRQEMLCDFNASTDDTLIPLKIIHAAAQRLHPHSSYHHASIVFGIDPARFGDDRTVLLIRQGLQILHVEDWSYESTTQSARICSHYINKYDPSAVFIDDVGVGAGVADYLKELGHGRKIIFVNAGSKAQDESQYVNWRAEMWDNIRFWLEEGGALPSIPQLHLDLATPTYTFDRVGRLKLESKEDIKKRGLRSPDYGDALGMTFAMPVASKVHQERDKQRHQAISDGYEHAAA
jgi:hypothetical protein